MFNTLKRVFRDLVNPCQHDWQVVNRVKTSSYTGNTYWWEHDLECSRCGQMVKGIHEHPSDWR